MTDYLQTISSAQSHQGLKRANNEDYVTFYEPGDIQNLLNDGQLYIVADGVGGESSGEFASRYAAEKVSHDYFRNTQVPPAQRIEAAMTQANTDIQEYTSRQNLARMATTLVAAVVRQNRLMIANVGDSRAYLIRDGQVQQVSQDHNLVGEMSRAGIMTEEEAMESAVKNRLMRSIGGHPDFKVDIFPDIELKPGDRILLCSDGLTRYASRPDIAAMVTLGTPQEVTQRLVDYALKKGGADNISVVLVEIGNLVPMPTKLEAGGHTPHPITLDTLFEKGGKTISIKTSTIQAAIPTELGDVEKAPEVTKSQESTPTMRVQVPVVNQSSANSDKTMEIKSPDVDKTMETSKPVVTPLPIPTKLREQPGKPTPPLPKTPSPAPYGRKKVVSPFKRIIPIVVLVLFVITAVAVLAFLAIQIKDAITPPPPTATQTATPKPSLTPTKPQATTPVQVQKTADATPDGTLKASPGTAISTGSTPQGTITITLTIAANGLPAEFCVKQIPEGGNLTAVLKDFGVVYKTSTTYYYFTCSSAKFSDCKSVTVKELAPENHGSVQALWWLVIPDQNKEICTQKIGEWAKK